MFAMGGGGSVRRGVGKFIAPESRAHNCKIKQSKATTNHLIFKRPSFLSLAVPAHHTQVQRKERHIKRAVRGRQV